VVVVSVVLLAMLATANVTASSQPLYFDHPARGSFTVEWCHPHLGEDYSLATSGMFFTLRAPLSRSVLLQIEVPSAHLRGGRELYGYWHDFQVTPVYRQISGSAIGNVLFGIEFIGKRGYFGNVSLRLATAPDNEPHYDEIASVGLQADPDRLSAFDNCYATLAASVGHRSLSIHGVETTVLFAPNLYLPSKGCGDSKELGFAYGASMGAVSKIITFRAGLSGFIMATSEYGNFGERTYHHLGFQASYNGRYFRPGVGVRVRLDEDPEELASDYVLNASILLAFK
jgi:hypothetical protein